MAIVSKNLISSKLFITDLIFTNSFKLQIDFILTKATPAPFFLVFFSNNNSKPLIFNITVYNFCSSKYRSDLYLEKIRSISTKTITKAK